MFEIIEASPAIIEANTVYSEALPHNNRRFGRRYWHKDKETVIKAAQNAVQSIDSYASPRASNAYKMDNDWAVDVTWYSVD